MKKWSLVLLVMLFSSVVFYFGRDMFQTLHNVKPIEFHIKGFSPDRAVYFDLADNVTLHDGVLKDLMDFCDNTDSTLLIKKNNVSEKNWMLNFKTTSQHVYHFLYSNDPHVLSPTLISRKENDWGRNGNVSFADRSSQESERILSVSDVRPAHELNVTISIHPLAQISQFYPNVQNSTMGLLIGDPNLIVSFLDKMIALKQVDFAQLGTEFFASDLTKYDRPVNYTLIYFLLFFILATVLTSYIAQILASQKEIGIRRLHGQSGGHIFQRLFQPINLWVWGSYLVTTIVLCAVFIGALHPLALQFYGVLVLVFTTFVFVMLGASLLSRYYIQRMKVGDMLKSNAKLKSVLFVGLVLKLGITVIIVLSLSKLIPVFTDFMNEKKATEIYDRNYVNIQVDPDHVEGGTEDVKISRINNIYQEIFNATNSGGFAAYGESEGTYEDAGMDGTGKPVFELIEYPTIVATYQFLELNHILDENGNPILFDTPPKQTILYQPSDWIDPVYSKGSEDYPYGQVVKIKAGQHMYLPNGRKITSAAIRILGEGQRGFMISYYEKGSPEFQNVMALLTEKGIREEELNLEPLIVGEPARQMYRLNLSREIGSLLFFGVIAYLLLSYHNTKLAFQIGAKRWVLRYLHGVSFWRRALPIWALLILPVIIGLSLLPSFPSLYQKLLSYMQTGLTIILPILSYSLLTWLFIVMLITDMLLATWFIRRIQRQSTEFLKGEV